MAIVMNIPCSACRETGHDQRGTNMMVFSDGSRYCSRAHWHKSGKPLFLSPDSDDPIMDMEIDGTIKYTQDQFRDLVKEGKLAKPEIRAIALSGMRGADRWEVCNDEEKQHMQRERDLDHDYFNGLKVKNLTTRHIKGQIAKMYNVRVGHDTEGNVDKHYYPIYGIDGEWKGAKCRTLPKDFRFGSLGWTWGKSLLFGQHILTSSLEQGARQDVLLLVGGECDVMAAQQILLESRKGTKWEGIPFHIWSPTKGECAVQDILDQKEEIGKFRKIITCFDADEVGAKISQSVAKLFRGKVFKMALPSSCKDANDCLKQGKEKEFIDSWFNPVDPFEGGVITTAGKYRDKAKNQPTMGLSWPWPELDPVTYGIRENFLAVLGAGTGCGKTKATKTIVNHIIQVHKKPVVVIYLEEQAEKTVRSFAGEMINKDLTAPPINDKSDPEYTEMRDYTKAQADAAIDKLCDDGMLIIGDLKGRKDADAVLEVCEEALALGYQYFVIDNLTAFEHKGANGKESNAVEAVKETMKRLGTFKDENPVFIFLLSHLKKVFGDRKPYEEGGYVGIQDFLGSGSITFWANVVFGLERNTIADSMEEKCLTCIHCLKNRDVGYKVGTRVYASFNFKTGKLEQTGRRPDKEDEFDYGTKPKKAKEQPESEEDEF